MSTRNALDYHLSDYLPVDPAPDSPEQNVSPVTQPAIVQANGTSETREDNTSLRLVDSPVQAASPLANGHPPELHSAPESVSEDAQSEEDEEDEDEEEEEPVLKYEKMGGIVNEILEKDTASAIAVSSKLVVCSYERSSPYGFLAPPPPPRAGSRNPQWRHPRHGLCRQPSQILSVSPCFNKRHSNRCVQ